MSFGAVLARGLGTPDESPAEGAQLHLSGPLGAGKTTVVRALLRALGITGPVRSPTYTLIEPYRCAGWRVMHYDLYRLDDGEELELLGAREHLERGTLCCVEWPERGAGWLPPADLELTLTHEGSARKADLAARGVWGQGWLARVRALERS